MRYPGTAPNIVMKVQEMKILAQSIQSLGAVRIEQVRHIEPGDWAERHLIPDFTTQLVPLDKRREQSRAGFLPVLKRTGKTFNFRQRLDRKSACRERV